MRSETNFSVRSVAPVTRGCARMILFARLGVDEFVALGSVPSRKSACAVLRSTRAYWRLLGRFILGDLEFDYRPQPRVISATQYGPEEMLARADATCTRKTERKAPSRKNPLRNFAAAGCGVRVNLRRSFPHEHIRTTSPDNRTVALSWCRPKKGIGLAKPYLDHSPRYLLGETTMRSFSTNSATSDSHQLSDVVDGLGPSRIDRIMAMSRKTSVDLEKIHREVL